MNQKTSTILAAQQSLYRLASDVVLASMPLVDDTDRMTLSKFEDDHWEMRPGVLQSRGRNFTSKIDFTVIDCMDERLTAKEYLYAALNERMDDRSARLHPVSATSEYCDLRRFMTFVRKRIGQFDIRQIDQDMIDNYRVQLASKRTCGARQIARCLKPIVQLRRLGPYLTHGGLTFLPWNGRSPYVVAGCEPKGDENKTPRIPEPVIGAMLHWSLKYIDLFATDIFLAREELADLEKKRATRPRQKLKDVLDRIRFWIDSRRQAGRGVPVWESPAKVGGIAFAQSQADGAGGDIINLRLIVLQTGINMQTIQENDTALKLIRDAVIELGTEVGGMDTPILIDPDTGRPWRNRFDAVSLIEEEKNLQAASYVVCAYLTGMRDAEIQAMKSGCMIRALSSDGLIERLKIRSTVYKFRESRGDPAEWVTIEPVDRAVTIVERLADQHRRERGQSDLWLTLDDRSKDAGRGIVVMVKQINRLRAALNERYSTKDNPAIPEVDGRPWSFSTRQFRRTVAWYIANRPFGVVAGKIQYKHASVAMFDGYAGSSASGFRQEIEQERALGQLDDVVEQYEAHQRGQRQAGPAAARLGSEYDRVEQELGPLPGRIADKGRLRAMLSNLARTLHVGHLNDCFFEPATALCMIEKEVTERSAPALSRCSPDRCPNACITSRHLSVWEASIAEADELLKDKRIPRFQREALQNDNERKRKLIAPLTSGGTL